MNTCNNVCPEGKATSYDVKTGTCTCADGSQIAADGEVIKPSK